MSGTQLLRLLVNERLTAAAEEIFGLVEKSIAEYQDEAVRSKREIIQLKEQIEQLTVLKPEVVLFRADSQPVSEERPPSLLQFDIKVEVIPVEHLQVNEKKVNQCIGSDMEAETSTNADAKREINHTKQQIDQLAASEAAVTPSRTDTQLVSEEILPSQQPDQLLNVEENKTHDSQQVRVEQVDRCFSTDMELDTSSMAEVRHPTSEPDTNGELLPPPTAETVSIDEDVWNRFIEMEDPRRDETSCRFCGKRFDRDSFLKSHVAESHSGHKAFKCLECNKEFEHRYHLVQHTRVHTGEKPFSCDFCGRTFSQNCNRLSHMRKYHTEKPTFHGNSNLRNVIAYEMQSESEITPEGVTVEEDHKEKAFKRSECSTEFKYRQQLVKHMEIHTDENPFSGDVCGKTFTQNRNLLVHMQLHTGEKPYFCNKCGISCSNKEHFMKCKWQNEFTLEKGNADDLCGKTFLQKSKGKNDKKPYSCDFCKTFGGRHAKNCKGKLNRRTNVSLHCTMCSEAFQTEAALKVHMNTHELWTEPISEDLP